MDDVWQDNIEGVRHRHIADFLTDGNLVKPGKSQVLHIVS